MMKTLSEIAKKDSLNVIGLMSGTSLDGMDAALVRLTGFGLSTKVEFLGFLTLPYREEERAEILSLAGGEYGGTRRLSLFNFWLGQKALEACRAVCEAAGLPTEEVDLVGSHGQTLYHLPVAADYLGQKLTATLQLGEASVIAEGLGCPVVSDFRVRDMAAGGQAAPLVPYTEFLLYRSEEKTIGLQNIGGIGNLTVLPRACAMKDVYAFDTGPGNMVIDQLASYYTDGKLRWDVDGLMAARGQVNEALLLRMLDDPYLGKQPPKTTGREYYGADYVASLVEYAKNAQMKPEDVVATATRFTAECIALSWERYCPERPEVMIIGGGGAHNPTLMRVLRERLPIQIITNEDLGLNGDAKEAVAFAILANECVHESCNNVPGVTGARHPVVMGKISL